MSQFCPDSGRGGFCRAVTIERLLRTAATAPPPRRSRFAREKLSPWQRCLQSSRGMRRRYDNDAFVVPRGSTTPSTAVENGPTAELDQQVESSPGHGVLGALETGGKTVLARAHALTLHFRFEREWVTFDTATATLMSVSGGT